MSHHVEVVEERFGGHGSRESTSQEISGTLERAHAISLAKRIFLPAIKSLGGMDWMNASTLRVI